MCVLQRVGFVRFSAEVAEDIGEVTSSMTRMCVDWLADARVPVRDPPFVFSSLSSATFTLPGGILPPAAMGLRFDHAFVTFDATTGFVDFVSNTVGFTLLQ